MRYIKTVFTCLICLAVFAGASHAQSSLESVVKEAVVLAKKHLDLSEDKACLTNAGYSEFNGTDTRMAYEFLATQAGVSIGKGTLLPVHSRVDAPLFFAFVTRTSSEKLVMVRVCLENNTLACSEPVNVRVKAGTDFSAFGKHFGKQAFSLVTLANGWADGVPWDIMQGALYHDHLCCGVSTGYCVSRFIREKYPLAEGDKYAYIGAPAWCQDDLIMTALNLTPGKHGYFTMNFPWSRAWKTDQKTYDQLGGIIIRYNPEKETGQAVVLNFDWQMDAFKKDMGQPDIDLAWKQWKHNPWLHVLYNRFLIKHLEQPGMFVSEIKKVKLNKKADFDRLVNMGANPLKVLLGPDESWEKEL